jgi:hypothetical protein
MFFKKKKEFEKVVDSLTSDTSFLVKTTDTSFLIYVVGSVFYTRKIVSKDARYGLVTSIDGNEKYKTSDLELGSVIAYFHPRLGRSVSAGRIQRIEIS